MVIYALEISILTNYFLTKLAVGVKAIGVGLPVVTGSSALRTTRSFTWLLTSVSYGIKGLLKVGVSWSRHPQLQKKPFLD